MIPIGFITKKTKNDSCDGCHFAKSYMLGLECLKNKYVDYCMPENIIFIKEYLPIKEICEKFDVSPMTIGRLVKQGLPHKTEKPKGRFEQRVFKIEDVQKWIDEKKSCLHYRTCKERNTNACPCILFVKN